MKKSLYSITVALVILVSSCHHDNPSLTSTGNGGTWSFSGITYHAAYTKVSAGASGNSFYASSGSAYSGTDSTLSLQFYGAVTQGQLFTGTFTIAHQIPPDSNQVYIAIHTGGPNLMAYGSTVGYGNETVTVSLVNGKYNIVGSGIKLQNLGTNYADSNSTLSLNVTQQ